MSRIPENVVESLLDSANIVDIIGEDITLRKAGVNYKGLCPFHDDKTPSFVVSPSKGICKCFACGKGGNVIWYLQEKNGWTFQEACRWLGKRLNIEVPEEELTPEERQKNDDRESARIVATATNELYQQNLSSSVTALKFLEKRKINAETMRTFAIGYSYEKSQLRNALEEKGYQLKYMQLCDVVRESSDKQGEYYDTFRKRVTLPYFNRRGEVIGFTGRDITDTAPAKYLNTGDTVLFNKGHNLWGLYQANKDIRSLDKVYIVEGQFDVMSLHQNGVKNVVAGSGTAFTPEQIKLLRGVTLNVTFIYDGDAAGIHAAQKNLPDMVSAGFHVTCIRLPEGKDPDDMAKEMGADIKKWLQDKEISYVKFLGTTTIREAAGEHEKLEAVKAIANVIARESENIIREAFITELVNMSGYGREDVTALVDGAKVPKRPDTFSPGIFGFELIDTYIDKDDPSVELVGSFDRWQKLVGEERPVLFYHGLPSEGCIQEFAQKFDHVIVHSPNMECSVAKESDDILMMKALYNRHVAIDVVADNETKSFIFYYIGCYGKEIAEAEGKIEVRNKYIERCAEVISWTSSQEQTINLPDWANMLGLKPNQLKEMLRPFLNLAKAKARVRTEGDEVWSSLLTNNLDVVPSYVEDNEEYSSRFKRFWHFPLLNKAGMPVAYVFKDDKGSLHRVGDFFLEPLFHIYSDRSEENLRVCRLNSMVEKPTYIAWPSKTFANLRTVVESLINEGGYNFENGTSQDWSRIWTYMSHKFPKCNEIKVYGQQKEGCWLFANAIYHEVEGEYKLEYADELGLMKHEDINLYSPSFSKVNKKMRDGDDDNEQDKWFVYTDTPVNKRITFEHWARLMNEVYNVNDNGKWATIFAIMCAFRSDIHPIRRLFTSIFFLGPTMSGKTQIAISIRSLFVKPEAPSFNLNFGSDAAFFSTLERFRDVPQVMEEYNDEKISDNKFQGLKSVTYDGDGKTKRKDATSNNIAVSKVYAPVVLLGQESPQKDDNALANRVVLCNVPKREHFDEHAQLIFQELKDAEKEGLSYLLLELLKLRPLFRKYFADLLKQTERDIQNAVEQTSDPNGDQARVITTVSMFASTVKLLTLYAPQMQLPFTYDDFFKLAVEKVKWQVQMLMGSDKIATFFAIFSSMLDDGDIKEGRDFVIKRGQKVTLKGGQTWVPPNGDSAVVYFNLTNIHNKYQKKLGSANHPLTLQTLTTNLTSNKAWIGAVGNWKFKWKEATEVAASDVMSQPEGAKPNMTVLRQMVDKTKQTSAVVLNYDVIAALYGIDLEREVKEDVPAGVTEEQGNLPF